MGKRGPRPAPTRLKLLKGETRPSRVNYSEPEPRDRLPVPPPDITDAAAQVWQRVLAEFGHTKVIRASDQDMMRLYCEAVVRYEESARLLAASGPLIQSKRTGELIKNPLHQVVRDNATLVRQLANDLGLTPAARSSLKGEDAAPAENKLSRFLA